MALLLRVGIGFVSQRCAEMGTKVRTFGCLASQTLNNTRGSLMSVLLVAAALAASASIVATGCIAYILISFRRSGHVMASRLGYQSPALVLAASENSRRRQTPKIGSALGAHHQPRPTFAH
jgi:hypothetical protein